MPPPLALPLSRSARVSAGFREAAADGRAGPTVSTVSTISVAAIAGRTVRVARHIGTCVLFVLDTWRLLKQSPGAAIGAALAALRRMKDDLN